MRLGTRIRFAIARLMLKAAALPVAPEWLKTTFFMPTFRALVREAYKKNAAFFACVSALAFAYPEPPLMVWTKESDDADPLANHPIRKLLKQPNPLMGERRFNTIVMTYMAIGGVCYVHKVRDGARRVIQLWPYHIAQMIPVPGGPAWIERYDFDDGTGRLQPIPADDVIAITWPDVDPDQPWTALPPLTAAAGDTDTANEIRRYVFNLLKNDAVPRGVLELPENSALNEPELRRMRNQWHERYGGDNRGELAILEGGAKYNRIGLNMEELAAAALFDIPEAHICAVMRVPPIIAGLNVGLQRSTFSNYGEARQAFTQDTMCPIWAIAGDALRVGLVQEFGNGVNLRHDLSKVQALQEHATEKWGRVDKAFLSGYLSFQETRAALGYADPKPDDLFVALTQGLQRAQALTDAAPKSTPILGYHIESGTVSRNEARAQLGLMPEDETIDDKLRKLQSLLAVAQAAVNVGFDVGPALQLVGLDPGLAGPPKPPLRLPPPADQQPPPGQEPTPQAQPPKALPQRQAKQSAVAQRTARKLQKIRRDVAKRMESAVDDFFADLADQVVARVGKSWKPKMRRKDLPGEDELLLDDDWIDLTNTVKRYYIEVIEASWPAWNSVLGVEVAFELTDPAVVATLKTAGRRVVDISETTRGFLAQVLQDGAAAGVTIQELVPGIRLVIEESYKNRARAIARTELAEAQNRATYERYKATNVTHVTIFDNGQDDPDDACAAVNGTVQTLEWFKANPTQHPNCTRCAAPVHED